MPRDTRKTKTSVINFLNKVPKIIAGDEPPISKRERRIYNVFWATVAHSLFEQIYQGYIRKSQGRADSRGEVWEDLAVTTKAYKKQKARKSHLSPNQKRKLRNTNTIGLLTPNQHKEWKKIFGTTYHKAKKVRDKNIQLRKRDLRTDEDLKAMAAAKAWEIIKDKGGETLIGTLGNADIDIMVETGTLLKSLRPGKFSKVKYKYIKGDRNQVHRIQDGVLEIGTKVPHAVYASKIIRPPAGREYMRGGRKAAPFSRKFLPEDLGIWFDIAVEKGKEALGQEIKNVLEKR